MPLLTGCVGMPHHWTLTACVDLTTLEASMESMCQCITWVSPFLAKSAWHDASQFKKIVFNTSNTLKYWCSYIR
jgi:hypothetical protein